MEIIPPMLAKLTDRLPQAVEAYGFEIKWDGLRTIVYIEDHSATLLSRNNKNISNQYPEILTIADYFPVTGAVLDGEIVAFDADGRPSFSSLQHRMNLASAAAVTHVMQEVPVTLVIFDILVLEGNSLLEREYSERRRILESLNLAGPSWLTPSYTPGGGRELIAISRKMGLEGIVAKKLDSTYQPGRRTGAWLKIKNQKRQELVIGGWMPGQGARAGQIGALLVGYYKAPSGNSKASSGGLHYAGKVGTGFTRDMLELLAEQFQALSRTETPFAEGDIPQGAHFIEPTLVGEFEFTEWTPNQTLRHPSFKGLRSDKEARDVILETT